MCFSTQQENVIVFRNWQTSANYSTTNVSVLCGKRTHLLEINDIVNHNRPSARTHSPKALIHHVYFITSIQSVRNYFRNGLIRAKDYIGFWFQATDSTANTLALYRMWKRPSVICPGGVQLTCQRGPFASRILL